MHITINQSIMKLATVVRDLGVLFDGELSIRQQVSRLSQTCFYHLRRLRSVRHQLGRNFTAKLVSAFVLSRLDCCNAVLTGLPASRLAPLLWVFSAAARIVVGLGPRDHVTPSLCELHWLPIAARIDYKISGPQVVCWPSTWSHYRTVDTCGKRSFAVITEIIMQQQPDRSAG